MLRSEPRWGSSQRSTDPLAGGEGVAAPSPPSNPLTTNPTSALGLRPCGLFCPPSKKKKNPCATAAAAAAERSADDTQVICPAAGSRRADAPMMIFLAGDADVDGDGDDVDEACFVSA